MRTAVADEEIAQFLSEVITPIASVPEAARASWYRSLEAFSRRSHPDALYPLGKVAGATIRLAHVIWDLHPSQEEDPPEQRP